MTNRVPQPYHGCLVLLPHTAHTFLQGTALSHRSNPVSSPFKESFSEPLGVSLGSQCYSVDPGHQTLIFTGLFTACLTCHSCTAEHEVMPPGREGGSPTQAGSRKIIKFTAGYAPKELQVAEPNLQPQPLSKAPAPLSNHALGLLWLFFVQNHQELHSSCHLNLFLLLVAKNPLHRAKRGPTEDLPHFFSEHLFFSRFLNK